MTEAERNKLTKADKKISEIKLAKQMMKDKPASRKQRRLVQKQKSEIFSVIVKGFWQASTGKTKEQILELYNHCDKKWRDHCKKINHSTKEIHLYEDAFEYAIMVTGHKAIKDSKVPARSKLYALHLLHPIQGRSKFYYFLRDFFIWMQFIFFEMSVSKAKARMKK